MARSRTTATKSTAADQFIPRADRQRVEHAYRRLRITGYVLLVLSAAGLAWFLYAVGERGMVSLLIHDLAIIVTTLAARRFIVRHRRSR